MASFASSATTCGARKHAWTNFAVLHNCAILEHFYELLGPVKSNQIAVFFSPCRYASDKYHKPNFLLKKYFDSKGEMCPSRTNSTANPWPKTQLLTVLKHCSLIIFVRYIKKIAFHINISNFPKNDPPYCRDGFPSFTRVWVLKSLLTDDVYSLPAQNIPNICLSPLQWGLIRDP